MTLNVVYGSGATHDRQAAVQRLVSDGFDGVIARTVTGAVADAALIASLRQMLAYGSAVILQVSCSTEEQAAEMIGELVECAPTFIPAPARLRAYLHVA